MLKSDQDGIESFTIYLNSHTNIVKLKSDQDGIESISTDIKWIKKLMLKSDQDGIESLLSSLTALLEAS